MPNSSSSAWKRIMMPILVGMGMITTPKDDTPQRPYGGVHVAVNLRGRETCRRLSFNGNRVRVREWAADAALALVRLWVLKQDKRDQDNCLT